MSENTDKTFDITSSKALLYSEILDTSVTGHICGLLQRKEKTCTFHVERSSVLARASKLLQSIDKATSDVQNIEDVEEGKPVIDMSVTLIERAEGSEYDSDSDTENGDLERKLEDKRIILCSDSESELSENKSMENVYKDENMLVFSDSDSELSENESGEIVSKIQFIPFDFGSDQLQNKQVKTVIKEDFLKSSNSEVAPDDEKSICEDSKLSISPNSGNDIEGKEVGLKAQMHNILHDSDDELSCQKSGVNTHLKKYPEPSELDFGQSTSDSKCEYQSYLPKLGFTSEKKRKLISVIEEVDGQNFCHSTKQKRV